jgi:hypothetical protein
MSTIRIKRSGTGGNPAVLAQGELAYSYLTDGGYLFNGGDRLYIGTGNETFGNTANHTVIGGKFFTDMLDHNKGVLTASSAIVTNAGNKIDTLNVSNLTFGDVAGGSDFNVIQATNLDGNVVLRPDGLGYVQIDTHGQLIIPVGTNGQRGVGHQGAVRFNTDLTTFEGYNGTNWASLGGVRSVDNKAYIIAEATPGAGDDVLQFWSGASGTSSQVGTWNNTTGLAVLGNITSSNTSTGSLVVTGGVGISGDLHVGGTIHIADLYTADVSATQVVYGGSDGKLQGTSGFTFNDSTGTLSVTELDVGSLVLASNSVSTTSNTGSVTLNASGGYSWVFGTDGNIVLPGGGLVSSNSYSASSTVGSVWATNNDAAIDWKGTNTVYAVGSGIEIYTNSSGTAYTSGVENYWNFATDGTTAFPNYTFPSAHGTVGQVLVDNGSGVLSWAEPASALTVDAQTGGPITVNLLTDTLSTVSGNTNITTSIAKNSTTVTTSVTLADTLTNLLEIDVGDLILSGHTLATNGNTGNVEIIASTTHGDQTWTFDGNGALTLPVTPNGNGIGGEIIFPSTITGTQATINYNADVQGGAFELINTDGTNTLYAGLNLDGNNIAFSTTTASNGTKHWNFNSDGTTYFPNYNFPAAHGTVRQALVDDGNGNLSWSNIVNSVTAGTNLNTTSNATTGNVTVNLDTTLTGLVEIDVGSLVISNNEIAGESGIGDVVIETSDGADNYTWTFGTDGNASFPGQIKNINDPTDPQDAATKYYVDHVAAGLHVHTPAMAATTDTLASITGGTVTYNNGTSGIGATLTLSTPLTILDNYSLHDGDRVLVKNESDLFTNGIYTWATGGTVLTRATDFNTTAEIAGGDFLFVQHGTEYGSTGWVQANTTTSIGVSDIQFSQFSGQGTFLAGDGIKLTGNVFSVNLETNSGLTIGTHKLQVASSIAGNGLTYTSGVINAVGTSNRISVSSGAIDIDSNYVGQTSITTVGTVTTGTWHGNTVTEAYGGTGQTSYTRSDLLVGNTGGGLSILGLGSAGQVLRVNAAGTDLEYADLDGGTY